MELSRASEDSDNENASRASTMEVARRKRERTDFIGSLFCKGVPSEAESVASIGFASTKSTDKKSRSMGRLPLKTTDLMNKDKIVATPPSHATAACGFQDTFTSLLPTSARTTKSTRSDFCECNGACGTCWDASSSKQLLPLRKPPPDPGSIPVIEDLGVTPKSKARQNKYSTTTNHAMNSPGDLIPTPAPIRKKYSPLFENIPEAIASASLPAAISEVPTPVQEAALEKAHSTPAPEPIEPSTVQSANEDEYLPDDFVQTKENTLVYTENDMETKLAEAVAEALTNQEAELELKFARETALMYTEEDLKAKVAEALANQEAELEMKYANSQDSGAIKDLQLQLQQKLEEQGAQWNKDMQERLEANKSHYRKKQSVLKTRIAELEDKCQSLEKGQEDERGEHNSQMEKLRSEMSKRQESHDAERTRLITEIAKQNERISDLTKDKANQADQSCTPGFIRDLQLEVRSLHIEKGLWDSRETELKDQIRRLEENTEKLVKSVGDRKDDRDIDHRRIAELEDHVVRLGNEKSALHDDLVSLRKKLSTRDSDVTMMEAKFIHADAKENEMAEKLQEKIERENKLKAGLQRCIRTLSVRPNVAPEATTPFDESDWVDSSLETLNQLISKLGDQVEASDRRAKEAELTLRKETDSRVSAELEVGRLSAMLQSRNSEDKGAFESESGPSDDNSDSLSDRKPAAIDRESVETVLLPMGMGSATKRVAKSNPYETPPRYKVASRQDDSCPSDGSKQGSKIINSYLNIFTSEVLTQLKHDIEALKKIIRHDDAPPYATNNDNQLCLVGEAWVLPKYAVEELNKLVEDIYEQLNQLQDQHGRPTKKPPPGASRGGDRLSFGATNDLLEQLESQKSALAKKEKEHFDEVRKVQKLQEEVAALKAKPEKAIPDEERDDWQSKGRREGSYGSLIDVDSESDELHAELENLQAKLAAAEGNISRLMDDIATKKAEKEEIIRAIGLSHERATLFENRMSQLLDSMRENATDQVSQLRSEIQETLEVHYAESLTEDEKEVQELLVMLELKQDNEKLTGKVQEQEEEAVMMLQTNEKLEKQVIDLTSKCNSLGDTLERREQKITSLVEEASYRHTHQALMEKKIDAIIRHIETVESEQELNVEPVLRATPSDGSNNERPVDIQKLERVEQHLLYIWDDFTRKKVEELTNQRQLLATMKENIEKHRQESREQIEALEAKVTESEQLLKEARQESQSQNTIPDLMSESVSQPEDRRHEHQELQSKIDELEKELELKQHESHSAAQELQEIVSELESNLEKQQHDHQRAEQDMQGVIAGLENKLEEKHHEHQEAMQWLQAKLLDLESSSEEKQHEGHQSAQGLKDVIAKLEKQLEEKRHEHQQAIQEYQAKILELESRLEDSLHESHQASQDTQAKISELEKELEGKRHEHQLAMQELQSKLAEVENSHEKKQHDTHQAAQGMQAKVSDLEKELEQKRNDNQQAMQELQATITALESSHEEKQNEMQAQISQLEARLEEKRHDITVAHSQKESLKLELAEALDAVSKANEQSQQGFQSMVAANEKMATLATEKEKLSHKVASLETRVESLTREIDLQRESLEELETARAECARLQEQLEISTTESSSKGDTIRELRKQLASHQAECERLEKVMKIRSGNLQEEILKRTAELEAKANATIKNCEAQVRNLRAEHSKEIDELLSQLDEVEAEHTEKCGEKEVAVKEKDAIIAALGAQLAESQSKIDALERMSREQLEEARDALLIAQEEAESRKVELETLREAHAHVLESERQKREQAVEEAREETIQEATEQFEHFNALYRTMTQNYKSAATKVHELESELEASQQALDELSQDHATRIASLNSDLAEMKAEQAKADADAAKSAKAHLDDLEALRVAERDLQSRLSEAETNSRSIQKLLATVVKEKEDLIAENEELKSVCEEALEAMSTQSSG